LELYVIVFQQKYEFIAVVSIIAGVYLMNYNYYSTIIITIIIIKY